jgi:hypothetical protein
VCDSFQVNNAPQMVLTGVRSGNWGGHKNSPFYPLNWSCQWVSTNCFYVAGKMSRNSIMHKPHNLSCCQLYIFKKSCNSSIKNHKQNNPESQRSSSQCPMSWSNYSHPNINRKIMPHCYAMLPYCTNKMVTAECLYRNSLAWYSK